MSSGTAAWTRPPGTPRWTAPAWTRSPGPGRLPRRCARDPPHHDVLEGRVLPRVPARARISVEDRGVTTPAVRRLRRYRRPPRSADDRTGGAVGAAAGRLRPPVLGAPT